MMPWLEPVRAALARRLEEGSLPHAILLAGRPGLGKSELARGVAAGALCHARTTEGAACGQCRSCTLFAGGTHPDFHALGPDQDSRVIKVDQVRILIGRIALTSGGTLQVFLVDPADALNPNAANAFLKTLEEPTPGTLILLVASRPHKLPATVLSRCQRYTVTPPDREAGLAWLAQARPDCGADLRAEALDASAGAPLLAAALLDADAVEACRDTLRQLNALSGGHGDPLALAAQWSKDEHLPARLDWWCAWLKDALWERVGASPGEAPRLTVTADLASLVSYLDRLLEGRRLIETQVTTDLLLEDLLIGWRDLASVT